MPVKTVMGRLAKGFAVLLLLLLAVGYLYEREADARAARQHPRKGELVDIGGYRLHLYCEGSGEPTVVLDAGFEDSLEQWERVQPEIAKLTRVCSYDRAGSGWSDLGPAPRTAEHEAAELHTLLHRADVHGPYVLVGHSFSGLIAILFASTYSGEVTGMVLDDSVHPQETVRFSGRFSVLPSYVVPVVRFSARFGLLRLFRFCNHTGAVPDCPKYARAALGSYASYGESHKEAAAMKGFGEMPLAVLAHDPKIGLAGDRDDVFEAAWAQWQRELTHLSSNSTFAEAAGIGHEIQTDEPQLVTDAIVKIVAASRTWISNQLPDLSGGIKTNRTN